MEVPLRALTSEKKYMGYGPNWNHLLRTAIQKKVANALSTVNLQVSYECSFRVTAYSTEHIERTWMPSCFGKSFFSFSRAVEGRILDRTVVKSTNLLPIKTGKSSLVMITTIVKRAKGTTTETSRVDLDVPKGYLESDDANDRCDSSAVEEYVELWCYRG